MNIIGGEQEIRPLEYSRYLTRSGRESLRLVIESANLRQKHFLLPDFLCEVILDVLDDYGITYDFYSVDEKLDIIVRSDVRYDVFYIVSYFGKNIDPGIFNNIAENASIIIDDVFSLFPCIPPASNNWYSFNSLRKITPLADGSIVYSASPLDTGLVRPVTTTLFSEYKHRAKNLKYRFLHEGEGGEKAYLDLFLDGEKQLEHDGQIYGISMDSELALLDFLRKEKEEGEMRRRNYACVRRLLPTCCIDFEAGFYSFAPLLIPCRDEIRQQLAREGIYLAVHWPRVRRMDNLISDSIISIPLDSRYTEVDMQRICQLIRKHLADDMPASVLATMDNFDDFYYLKSDPVNIMWSGHAHSPDYEKLKGWFASRLSDVYRKIILFYGDGELLGYLYLDWISDESAVEIAYGIHSSVSGKGWGKKIVRSGVEKAREYYPEAARVFAWIADTNTASLRCAAAANMKNTGITEIRILPQFETPLIFSRYDRELDK